jgi:hypothetical protein
MSDGRDQDYTLAVGNGGSRKAANGAIKKLLILIQLNDVIAGLSASQETTPSVAMGRVIGRGVAASGYSPACVFSLA